MFCFARSFLNERVGSAESVCSFAGLFLKNKPQSSKNKNSVLPSRRRLMKRRALAMILCGVAIFFFSIFSFDRGGWYDQIYYEVPAKIGITLGAVLIVGGALLSKSG